MDAEIGRTKSPYHGVIGTTLLLAIVPLVLYFILRGAIFEFQPDFTDELNEITSRTLGCGLGFVFHLSCLIAGLLKDSFRAVTTRVKEFFSDLSISVKTAFTCYGYNLREYGVAFWIMFAVIIANFCFFVDGAIYFVKLYY